MRQQKKASPQWYSIITLILFFPILGYTQQGDEAPQKISQVYEQFSQAYEELNLPKIASLYHKEAYYLTPNSDEALRHGIGSIIDSFRSTFNNARKRNSSLKISFDIKKRERSGYMAYDVGYYKFEAFPKKGAPFKSVGKFVTVLKKGDDGRWRLVVDAFSKAPVEAFSDQKDEMTKK